MTLTTVNPALLDTQAQYNGFKNRIINGAMVIDQRNAGASVNPSTGAYTLDRWDGGGVHDGVFGFQQVSDAPAGFVNSFKATVSTADASLSSTQYARFGQMIEGLNLSDFAWGTASATSITLSFWVKSSLTGTFGGYVTNSAENRAYVFSYTINAANTFEYKTVTIAGDTSGTWLTTNGIGLRMYFSLGAGSSKVGTAGSWGSTLYLAPTGQTNVLATISNTWQITGVQLEKGSTATSFDYRPYGTELALCQRYFEKSFDIDFAPANGPNATSNATDNGYSSTVAGNNSLVGGPIKYAVAKRTAATITSFGNNSGYWGYLSSSASSTKTWSANAVLFAGQGTSGFGVIQNVTNNVYYTIQGHWTASAEL